MQGRPVAPSTGRSGPLGGRLGRLLIGGVLICSVLIGASGCGSGTTTVPAPTATVVPAPTATVVPAPTPTDRPGWDELLLDAAGRGDLAAVQLALDAQASVDTADRDGQTALVRAAYGNHVAVAQALIAAGADVNRKDHTVQSAYLIATAEVGDDPRLLELTLAHGADVRSLDSWNGTGLIRAADRGFPRIIERLVAAGCPVNHVNRLGWTALHEAVILGDGSPRYVEVVRLLIAGGADVDLVTQRDGRRPLALARARGHPAIAQLLVEAGAHE